MCFSALNIGEKRVDIEAETRKKATEKQKFR